MSTVRTQIWTSSILMAVSSVALVLSLIGWPADVLHMSTGFVLAWLTPGYALLLTLFSRTLDRAWHIVLSLPTSIVVVILIGALLDLHRGGLVDSNFVWMLWMVSLLLTGAGLLRMRFSSHLARQAEEVGGASRTDVARARAVTRIPSRSPMRRIALVTSWLVLPVVLIGTLWWSVEGVRRASQITSTPFTALAITHTTTKSQQPQVMVANHEGIAVSYVLECWIDGKLAQRWDIGAITQDQQWHVGLPEVTSSAQAELKLFRAGETQPYRTAHTLVRPR